MPCLVAEKMQNNCGVYSIHHEGNYQNMIDIDNHPLCSCVKSIFVFQNPLHVLISIVLSENS